MRDTFADFVASSPCCSAPPCPLVFEHAPEWGGRLVLLGLLVPVLAALMAPFALVAAQLASDPAARAILAGRPLLGVQLLAGLVMLIWVFGWPLTRLARGDFARRRISISAGLVLSEAVGLFGRQTRVDPLADYVGVAHRARTSLSGVHQEWVLVHRQPSRSLVLGLAPQVSREALAAMAGLFAIAEIPSREAASVVPPHGYFPAAEPRPRLAA